MKRNIQHFALLTLVFGSISLASFGQQTVLSNFAFKNGFSINPANAGVDKTLSINSTHRQQWLGVSGSPSAFNFNIHGELSEKNSIGFKYATESYGLIRRNSASGTYVYNLKLNEQHKLRFGLSAGFMQNTINYSAIRTQDYSDEVILDGQQNSGVSFNADFGIRYSVGNFQIGLASMQIVEARSRMYLENDVAGFFSLSRHFVANTSYDFKVSNDWTITPFLLTEFTMVSPVTFEGVVYADWKNKLWFGAGYRRNAGILTSFGINISSQFIAGYSYEFGMNGIAGQSRGTHEIMIGFKLGNKKKDERIQELEDRLDRRITDAETKTDSLKLEMEARKKVSDELKSELKRLQESDEDSKEKIEDLEKRIEDLENKPEKKDAPEDPLKKLVYFDENNSTINTDSQKTLTDVITYLKDNSEQKIKVVGHTCNIGSAKANKEFSATRAKVVVNYLIAEGISADRIETEGRGEDDPIFSNSSEVSRSLNRRVSFERK